MLINAWHQEPAMLQEQAAEFWLDRTQHVEKLVAILEKLTARRDLSFLTLLQWHSWQLNFNLILSSTAIGYYCHCKHKMSKLLTLWFQSGLLNLCLQCLQKEGVAPSSSSGVGST